MIQGLVAAVALLAAANPAVSARKAMAHVHQVRFAAGPASSAPTAPEGAGSVECDDDGYSGMRVQVLYATVGSWNFAGGGEPDWTGVDRYTEYHRSGAFELWARRADAAFNASAAQTGGKRHVRFVTTVPSADGRCELLVQKIRLPSSGSFDSIAAEVRRQGYASERRLYLVWLDAGADFEAGATLSSDSAPGLGNINNVGGRVAIVTSKIWGYGWAEAHELMHLIGGVQGDAPHSTGRGHCTDEHDLMCYPEPGNDWARDRMTHPCDEYAEALFDCGHDDYFHTSPPQGSYLDTHWNSADSVFLIPCEWYTTNEGTWGGVRRICR